MRRPTRLPYVALSLCLAIGSIASADVRLHYVGRYRTQDSYHDHLVGVEQVGPHHALVSSNLDIVVVDLESLTVDGMQTYLDRLAGIDVYNTYTRPDGFVYANLRLGGLAVVRFDETALSLALLDTIAEPGVFYDKMALVGDMLFVTAHASGIRIFDLADPAHPTLIGSLDEGFDDAFAIAVDGGIAYVADGAGGLKIVDVSDLTAPFIVAGEDPASAAATAEDVLVIDHRAYVAYGGAGVAVYESGDIGSRVLYDTPICAESLARVGNHLAVADIGGLVVFRTEPDGSLTPAATESGQRRSKGGEAVTLRLWHDVSAWGDDRIVVADWDSMDVYELVDPAVDTQPDITASTHRIRFAPAGGSTVVEIRNQGSGPLQITDVTTPDPVFTVSTQTATVEPGGVLELTIDYAGGPHAGKLVKITSDDPDESPLPIEVFGETEFLDPGEPAPSFALQSWTYAHETESFELGWFDLDDHVGDIVYFHVFGMF